MRVVRSLLIGLLVASPLCMADSAQPLLGEGVGADISQPADKVLRAEGWELQIWYRAKGSRSEGQHGVLLQGGKAIKGKSTGEELETALGKMKFYGEVPTVMWEPSGWHFADKTLIKPSTFCP
ncbi:MAG: hypothetical protein JG718_09435 [Candidatus Thiothrix moscowensis]|nr:hypothetical protein [Candidatus Thiothrix moscowensis]